MRKWGVRLQSLKNAKYVSCYEAAWCLVSHRRVSLLTVIAKKGWKIAFWSKEQWYCTVVPRCPIDVLCVRSYFGKVSWFISLCRCSYYGIKMSCKELIRNNLFFFFISNPVWAWIHFLEWLNPLARSCPQNVGVLLSWDCITVESSGPLVVPEEGMALNRALG